MNMKRAKLSMLLLPVLFSLEARAQCTNASFNGTYFSSFGGTVLNGTTNVAHQDLGKVTADGNGVLTGTVATSVSGTITSQPFSGTYAVRANCSGTGMLASGSNSVSFTFQIVNAGSQLLASVTSSTLGQIGEGRFYRAANSTGSSCGTGSLSGTYGLLLSGGSYAAAVRTGFDAVGLVTFDGSGGATVSGEVTSGSANGIAYNGSGTYTLAADCTGTAQITSALGTVNYSLARIEGGGVLLLETDASTTISGSATPTNTQQVVPQIAFGGGWYSALYFSNTTAISQTFVVTFTADDGTPLTVPGTGATKRITLAANSTAIIEAVNSGSLSQGYATFSLPAGVNGYLVVRQSQVGIPDQEAVVGFKNANATATSFIFDDTSFTTGIALANTSAVASTITLTAYNSSGAQVGKGTLQLDAGKKYANSLRSIPNMSGVAGQRGTVLVTVANGTVAVLPLRFGGAAFTSIPTVQQQ